MSGSLAFALLHFCEGCVCAREGASSPLIIDVSTDRDVRRGRHCDVDVFYPLALLGSGML